MNWNKYPFLRLVAALALGIAFHETFGCSCSDRRWLWGVLPVLIAVLTLLHHTLKSFRYRWIQGVSVILAFAYLGYFRACLQEVKPIDGDGICYGGWCLARLSEPPVEREKSVKVVLDVEGFRTPSGASSEKGRVMAYFQPSETVRTLSYGDIIAFQAAIDPVAPPANPGEFDYRKYLERRGVTGTVFLKDGEWMSLGVKRTNALYAFAYRFRDRMIKAMRQCGITGDELSVGAAILLGYDDSLPAQIRHNYVAAGSMHILCVSGMHVGVIYLLASFLLGLLGNSKGAQRAKRLILLALIWLYALITGLSPSIMRSALMITMILFGELIHRKGFTLNSTAASAFVLLMINPNNLFAIGFQLSYAAVVGIVLLQKPICNLLYVKNKLLSRIWEITTVSIAAQIATTPFAIYYFNQFTPYFWLSNLLMTPLSFVVIFSGMLLLAVSWVPGLNAAVGKVVWLGLHAMNVVTSEIEQLPMSLVKGLYMDDAQFGMSLVLLLLLWLFVSFKRKRMLMEMLVLSTVLALSIALRSQQLARQSTVMVYALRNHTAVVVGQGFNSVLLCDEGLLREPSSIDYSLKGHWAERQWPTNPLCFTLDEDFRCRLAVKRHNLLSAAGVLLAFWDPQEASKRGPRITVDYLLVAGKQPPDLKAVLSAYRVGTLLIDGSVPNYLAERWADQAMTEGLPYVAIADGAAQLK